jgi:hypothetical protein
MEGGVERWRIMKIAWVSLLQRVISEMYNKYKVEADVKIERGMPRELGVL